MQLQLTSALGLLTLIGLAWLCSSNRRRFPWRTVVSGVTLQFAIALVILKTRAGQKLFTRAHDASTLLIQCAMQGAEMVFGPLARSVGALAPERRRISPGWDFAPCWADSFPVISRRPSWGS
jgi:CNT family concentrative nucleoside transporter